MKRFLCLGLALLMALIAPSARAAVAVSGSVSENGGIAALVSEDGETIIAPGVYSKILCVRAPDIFCAYSDSARGFKLINGAGELLTDGVYESVVLAGDALICEQGGLYGVMTLDFNMLTPCEYTWIVSNGEGGFLALRTDLWDDSPDGVYYIDQAGRESPTGVKLMSYLMEFSGGMSPALSTDNGRYGYLGARGQWALRPQYAYADWFIGAHAMATLDSGSGVIDDTGAWRITPKFDYVNLGPENSRLIVGVNYGKRITVFDAETYDERFSVPCDTYAAYVSNGGNLVCVFTEDSISVLNERGEQVLALSPDAGVFTVENGQLIVYDGAWGDECARVYGADGAPLSPLYQNLDYFGAHDGEYYYQYNRFDVKRSNVNAQNVAWLSDTILCGLIDSRGNTLLPANYLAISAPSPDLILAEGKYGMYLFDYQGKQIWSAGY